MDLASIAHDIDEIEKANLREMGADAIYAQDQRSGGGQHGSSNHHDDSGYFSVQVCSHSSSAISTNVFLLIRRYS